MTRLSAFVKKLFFMLAVRELDTTTKKESRTFFFCRRGETWTITMVGHYSLRRLNLVYCINAKAANGLDFNRYLPE